jgi:hypothetical protein
MKKILLALFLVAGFACTPCPSTNPDCNAGLGGNGGGFGGGNGGGGGTLNRYTVTTIDSAMSDSTYMDMVVDKAQNRVGIAYLVGKAVGDPDDPDAGAPVFEVRYTEWKDGVVSTPEVIDHIQRYVGLSIDFHPTTGEPSVAYLGGGSDMSLYWFNSDAVYTSRSGTTWTTTTIATAGFPAIMCGSATNPNPVSDNPSGLLIGVWSAIRYDSTGKLWQCSRDGHGAQYPQGDWGGSDVKCFSGSPGSWTGYCTNPGGNNKQGYGGRIRMALAEDKPFITYDQVFGSSDGIGFDVNFQQWNGTAWTADYVPARSPNTGTGSSPAYDSTAGYGVAFVDGSNNVLYYVDKSPTASAWNMPDQVYGAGTGGWEPSLAFDPMFHEPAIAYFNCSLQLGANADHCEADHQELVISQRINTGTMSMWRPETVTTEHAHRIRFGFLPNGKRVVVFREYAGGAVKIAVEN